MVQITVELNDSITLVSSDLAQPQIKSLEAVMKNSENSKKKEQHMTKKNVNIYDKNMKTKMKNK